MATDFSIDSVRMTYQPSRVSVSEAEGVYQQYPGGGYAVTERTLGRIVEVEWGDRGAREGVLSELRTKRGATYSHTVTWNDPAGAAQSCDVLIPPIPHDVIETEALGVLRLTMRERTA